MERVVSVQLVVVAPTVNPVVTVAPPVVQSPVTQSQVRLLHYGPVIMSRKRSQIVLVCATS